MEDLFAGHPNAVRLCHRVRKAVEGLGPVEVAVTGSQVSFRAQGGERFCWLGRPPEGVKGLADETVVLSLRYRLTSSRIQQVVEPRPGRFTHHLVQHQVADLEE